MAFSGNIKHYLGQGTLALRPADPGIHPSVLAFYLVTDNLPSPALTMWNGTTWITLSAGGAAAVWGSITGTLADQSDLATAFSDIGTALMGKVSIPAPGANPWVLVGSTWKKLIAGTNVTFDQSVAGELTVNAAGGGGGAALRYGLVGFSSLVTIGTLPVLAVPFNQVVSDALSLWNMSTSRFTVPTGTTKVRVSAGLGVTGAAVVGSINLRVLKNGVSVPLVGYTTTRNDPGTGFSDNSAAIQSAILDVVAGDYFTIRYNNNMTGITQYIIDNSYFQMELLN